MIKAISTEAPEVFHRDPDGSTVFRWDVNTAVDTEGTPVYEAKEARIYNTPTLENVETGAVEAYTSLSEQAALLHDNNESMLTKGVPTVAYETFLTERTKIKAAVKAYFDGLKVTK